MARIHAAVLLAGLLVPRLAGQCETGQILGPTGDPGAQMGGSVALTADALVVGLPNADSYGAASGEVRVYRKQAGNWVLTQSLGGVSTLKPGDRFGTSVSAEGPYIAVGADGVDGPNPDEGAAYVFKADATGLYVLRDKVQSDFGSTPGQAFGCSVSISGGWLIVGAKYADMGDPDSGAAFVYRESGTNWSSQPPLTGDFTSSGDLFGASVSTKNGVFAVGAPQDDVNGQDTGSVRVYWLDGTFLDPDDFHEINLWPGQANAHFGSAVAVSDLAVAVAAAKQDAGAQDSGAVHLFRMTAGTDWFTGDVYKSWILDQSLSPASAQLSAEFGSAIALDGTTLVVGSRFQDKLPAIDTGAIDVYRRAGPVWEHRKHHDPGQATQADYTGSSIAVSGPVFAAGAAGDDVSGAVDAGSVTLWSMTDCPGLYASHTTTTHSLPQPVQFALNAGPTFAFSPYLLLGSITGTSPGFNLHGAHVPLNLDVYSSFIATSTSWPAFWGQLDGSGKATSYLPQPLYFSPFMLGITLHHAFIAKGAPGTPWYASNAEPLAYVQVWDTTPFADAGPNLSVNESSFGGGLTLEFDGFDSDSPNGAIVQWAWDFGDNSSATGPVVSHLYKGGDYTATLTVIDEVGAGSQDTVTVHVNKMPLGVINVLTPNPVAGQPVQFSSANSFDPDGTIALFAWTFDGASVTKPGTQTVTEWTFKSPGDFEVSLTPIDDDGLAGSNIAEQFVDVAPCPPPPAPGGLVGSATSATTAFLTWQDHANNEINYLVLQLDPGLNESNPSNWHVVGGYLQANTTSLAVAGLVPDQTYKFKVFCLTDCGPESAFSNTVAVTPHCPSPTPAPFNCLAKRISNTSQPDPVKVTWSYSGPPVTAFRVARLDPGEDENDFGAWDNVGGDLPPTQFSYTDSFNLQNGQTYKYKVRNFINHGPPCGKVFSEYSNIDVANP